MISFMNKKVIRGGVMSARFIASGFAIVVDSSVNNALIPTENIDTNFAKPRNNGRNIDTVNINIHIIGMDNFIAELFHSQKIEKTFVYNGIIIHEDSNKIRNNQIKAQFFVSPGYFDKKTLVTIINRNNEYYIFNNKTDNYKIISGDNSLNIYDQGGTYYYYVSSSGSASHEWPVPLTRGRSNAC